MKVCMLVYNNCASDARVFKEAETLAAAGHRVQIVAVLDRATVPHETRDGFEVIRIDRNPVHYRILRAGRRLRRWLRLARSKSRRRIRIARKRLSRWLLRLRKRLRGRRPRSRREVSSTRAAQAPTADATRKDLPLGAWRRAGKTISGLPKRALMKFHKPLTYFDWYLRTYRLMRPDPADVYHAHDLNTLPVAVALARATRAKLVFDAHELYPELSTLSPTERTVWRIAERPLMRRADQVITVCESIADEIRSRSQVRRPLVLLNCPRLGTVDGVPDSSLLVKKLGAGTANGRPIVLYQGGFAPNRGLPELVAAAARFDNALLVLMGWGRLEQDLREQVVSEGLQGRVVISGPVPQKELLGYTRGAHIGVIPYRPVGLNNYYSTPNKLFEYMAAGVPLAVSRLPELVRFVEGLGVGRAFEPGDPAAIAAAVNALLRDPAGRAAMAERAREAARHYNWDTQAVKLLAAYDELRVGASSADSVAPHGRQT